MFSTRDVARKYLKYYQQVGPNAEFNKGGIIPQNKAV